MEICNVGIQQSNRKETYRKIPIISPGLIFVEKAFSLGLFSGELIFGGAYYWSEFKVLNFIFERAYYRKDEFTSEIWREYLRGLIIKEALSHGFLAFFRNSQNIYLYHRNLRINNGLFLLTIAISGR